MLVVETLTLAATVGALIGAGCYCFRRCPPDRVLVVRSRTKAGAAGAAKNTGSFRVTRGEIWINPLTEAVQEVNLSPLEIYVAVSLPSSAINVERLYIHLKVVTAPSPDDDSLARAAGHIGGLDVHRASRKLEELIAAKNPELPLSLVPQSAVDLQSLSLRGRPEWNEWLLSLLKPYGMELKSYSLLEVSRRTELQPTPRSQEPDVSRACRLLEFDPVCEEVQVEIAASQTQLGAVGITWLLMFNVEPQFDLYRVACENYLDKPAPEVNSHLSGIVSQAMHRALSTCNGYTMIDQLCESYKKYGGDSGKSSGKELAIYMLNAVSDAVSTWRGKLMMMRAWFTSANTAQKFFTTLVQSLEVELSRSGLKFGGLLFKDVDLQTSTIQLPTKWNYTSSFVPTDVIQFSGRTPIVFEGRPLTAVIWARVEMPRLKAIGVASGGAASGGAASGGAASDGAASDGAASDGVALEGASVSETTVSGALSHQLTKALATPKVQKLVIAAERLWAELKRDMDELRGVDGTLEDPVTRLIIERAALRLVLPAAKVVLALLDAYAEVRREFIKNCSRAVNETGGVGENFALRDFDIVDHKGNTILTAPEQSVQETAAIALPR